MLETPDEIESQTPVTRRGFTDKFLASLKPRTGGSYDVTDPARRGLTIRVQPTGSKTFFYRYQRGSRMTRLKLGDYPAVSLREAYEAYADCVRNLNRGEDPRQKRLVAQAAGRSVDAGGPTVGDLAQEFLKRYIFMKRKDPLAAQRLIELNILKPWRHRPLSSIKRRDGILLLDKIVDRGAPVTANHVAAILSQMFTFGLNRGLIEATPFIRMPRPGGTEEPRSRRLSDEEVRLFWRRLTRTRLHFEIRTALKLILVTAQRPGEVALARTAEFDLDRREWRIPGQRSKNGKEHVVPLNDLAIRLLRRLRRRYGETAYILPTRCWKSRGALPITVRALSQGVRDNAKCFGIEKFTPHDLRRTAASLMTAHRVPRLHVEKVLNHTIDDVAEIYDRHDYAEEKREALDALSAALVTIIRTKCGTISRRGSPRRVESSEIGRRPLRQ